MHHIHRLRGRRPRQSPVCPRRRQREQQLAAADCDDARARLRAPDHGHGIVAAPQQLRVELGDQRPDARDVRGRKGVADLQDSHVRQGLLGARLLRACLIRSGSTLPVGRSKSPVARRIGEGVPARVRAAPSRARPRWTSRRASTTVLRPHTGGDLLCRSLSHHSFRSRGATSSPAICTARSCTGP